MAAEKVEVSAESQQKQGQSERKVTMSRFYQLPQTINADRASCLLSEDGVLVITVPWKSCSCPPKCTTS